MDKQRMSKLQRRLQQRKLSVFEALQQEVSVQWLKTNNPAFLSMLTPEATIEIIDLLVTPGPPNDKTRSFKIPMIAADLLSTMVPKIYELFFAEDPEDHAQPLLGRLLRYFDGAPNYVISGYVVRIVMNLIPANPSRVIQQIFKSAPERMLRFMESQSVAELLLRIVVVEDALLNVQVKERVKLLEEVLRVYVEGKWEEEVLASCCWVLNEAVGRLWAGKHKEMGRFAAVLFKLVEAVIDNNNLYQQETLVVSLSKQVAVYIKEAPFVIAALYKKIQQELALGKADAPPQNSNTSKISQPKLTMKRYKYLQALFFIISHGGEAIAKQLTSANVFHILLDYITRYQWHSLALIEIQKILKATIHSHSDPLFNALSRSYFPQKLQQLARMQAVPSKFGCGFSGLLHGVVKALADSLETGTGYGAYLKKNGREGDLKTWAGEYLGRQKEVGEAVRVVHEVAKPFYSISKLPDKFALFFEQTQQINARLQAQSPSKHPAQEKAVLQEIENENELVYKLLSQLVSETVSDEKKPESETVE